MIDTDTDILARTVWAEARGETREGRIAVAWNIKNRALKSPAGRWPNTIAKVCRQPMQYSCWNKNDPNRSKLVAVTVADPLFAECLEIAQGVIDNKIPDPTKGCDHYHAIGHPIPELRRKGIKPDLQIGNHLFYNYYRRAKLGTNYARDTTPSGTEGLGCVDSGGAPVRDMSGSQNPSSPADALLMALGISERYAQSITLDGSGIIAAEPELLKISVGYKFAIRNSGYDMGDGEDWVLAKEMIVPTSRGIVTKMLAVRRDPDLPPPQIFLHDTTQSLTDPAAPIVPTGSVSMSGDFAKPTNGTGIVSSPFGPRKSGMHRGVDIAAPVGTPIHAIADGVVTDTVVSCRVGDWNCGGKYGNRIYVDHPGGNQSRYAHLSEVLVTKGQSVKKGDLIGRLGNTGRSTGPHLHFEIRVVGVPKNPVAFISPIV